MTQPDHQFRVVLRGYDPAQVDRRLDELAERVAGSEQQAAEAAQRARTLEQQLASASAEQGEVVVETPTYTHLGERIGQILTLADAEAAQLRDQATADAEGLRKQVEQTVVSLREEADRYAEQRKRDADAEAGRIVADALREADETRDAAERDGAARRQEAEAVYEEQRANAARAAADFETTLAERRERTAAEFREQQGATQLQLETMASQVEEMRARSEEERTAAETEARRIVTDAQDQAATIVRDARAAAERVRTDSDRELSAATQRRDSINAQLVNVRQMLATLSGGASGFAADPLARAEAPAPVETEASEGAADEPAEDATTG